MLYLSSKKTKLKRVKFPTKEQRNKKSKKSDFLLLAFAS
jgi:hypothetical protein